MPIDAFETTGAAFLAGNSGWEEIANTTWGTGRSLTALNWDTVISLYSEISVSMRFGATASSFTGSIPTDDITSQRQYRYGQDDAERAIFTINTPFTSGGFDTVATSLSAQDRVIIRAKKKQEVFDAAVVLDQPLPTSLANLGNWHGQNLQNAVTNGVMVGAGTGSAGTGAPHGAFTGAMRVRRIGDYVEQQFHTSNAPGTVVGEIFWRESYNAGTTWTAWIGQ